MLTPAQMKAITDQTTALQAANDASLQASQVSQSDAAASTAATAKAQASAAAAKQADEDVTTALTGLASLYNGLIGVTPTPPPA